MASRTRQVEPPISLGKRQIRGWKVVKRGLELGPTQVMTGPTETQLVTQGLDANNPVFIVIKTRGHCHVPDHISLAREQRIKRRESVSEKYAHPLEAPIHFADTISSGIALSVSLSNSSLEGSNKTTSPMLMPSDEGPALTQSDKYRPVVEDENERTLLL